MRNDVLGRLRSFLQQPPAPPAELSHQQWEQLTRIVDEALKRPDARERRRYLDGACRGEDVLKREVERLLGFAETDTDFLAGPLIRRSDLQRHSGSSFPNEVSARMGSFVAKVGDKIGRYQVESILGSGGMGVVVLVSDPELNRKVALKLLREKDAPELLHRFERELRLQAGLEHPSIVRLLDFGVANGLPYFTMDHIEHGEPINAWCDRQSKCVEERLKLVLKACDALGHAHQHLIVHRDLKPSNLLVDGNGRVRLLDFGIAKLLEQSEEESAAPTKTAAGRQALTLDYASPEQVRGSAVTIASDVYSLGVVTYELLCGHLPHALDVHSLDNVDRIFMKEPPPLSSRTVMAREVWRNGHPELVAPDEIARLRSSNPRRLRRRLAGDLDSIMAKALASDPKHRYQTMEQFSEDLEHHLKDRPVRTRRATIAYRAKKSIRRHRRVLKPVLLLSILVVVGVFGWVSNRQRARDAQEEAKNAQEEAKDAQEKAKDEKEKTTQRTLDFGEFPYNLLWAVIQDHPDIDKMLKRAEKHARVELADNLELFTQALESVGRLHQRLGNYKAARILFSESLTKLQETYPDDHDLKAHSLNNLGALEHVVGNYDKAERYYNQALAMRRRLGHEDWRHSTAQSNLASILMSRGDFDKAERMYHRLLDLRIRHYGETHKLVARTRRSLGGLFYLKGDFTRAERLLRDSLAFRRTHYGERSLEVALVLHPLGRVLTGQKRYRDAEAALTEALSIQEEHLDDAHLQVAISRNHLAVVLFDRGDAADRVMAEDLWRRAMEVLWEKRGPDSWEIAEAESHLGARLAAEGRVKEAEVLLVRSHETLWCTRGEEAIMTREAWERLETLCSSGVHDCAPHSAIDCDLRLASSTDDIQTTAHDLFDHDYRYALLIGRNPRGALDERSSGY